jgi:chloramphenicol-sensitive protein RarD
MSSSEFNKGIIFAATGSLWWGVLGVIYFEYISFVGHIESVLHRAIWTSLFLVITTSYLSKWSIFFEIIKIKKNLITLFFSGLLIFINWAVWIYAVSSDQIINASFGYFIMPILSVFLGYIFFKEKLNVKRIVSICFVLGSIFFLLIFNFQSLPWVGLIVALSWGFYNLLRKKISVDTDIGLLIESLFMLPFALIAFYVLTSYGLNDFNFSNISLSLILLLAGPMTVIPLFLYVRGVELSGLGATGMIFYITPTFQFILGYFYYNEAFSVIKLISFVIIWLAVIVYLRDLYENNASEG